MRTLIVVAGIALLLGLPDTLVGSLLGTVAKAYVLWIAYLVAVALAIQWTYGWLHAWRTRRLGIKPSTASSPAERPPG